MPLLFHSFGNFDEVFISVSDYIFFIQYVYSIFHI